MGSWEDVRLTAEDLSCSYSAFWRANFSDSSSKRDCSCSFFTAKVDRLVLISCFLAHRPTVSIFHSLQRDRKIYLSTHVEFVGLLEVLDCESLVVHGIVELVGYQLCFK